MSQTISAEPGIPTLLGSHAARNELAAYIEHRLASLRLQLEAVSCPDDEGRQLRGKIAELKKLEKLINNRSADD